LILDSLTGFSLRLDKVLFIQNATANAAWRRSQRNGLNKTN